MTVIKLGGGTILPARSQLWVLGIIFGISPPSTRAPAGPGPRRSRQALARGPKAARGARGGMGGALRCRIGVLAGGEGLERGRGPPPGQRGRGTEGSGARRGRGMGRGAQGSDWVLPPLRPRVRVSQRQRSSLTLWDTLPSGGQDPRTWGGLAGRRTAALLRAPRRASLPTSPLATPPLSPSAGDRIRVTWGESQQIFIDLVT